MMDRARRLGATLIKGPLGRRWRSAAVGLDTDPLVLKAAACSQGTSLLPAAGPAGRQFSSVPSQPPLFEKILVANRGEIACRIIRTARKLGIRTVAVYSEADKHCLHVKQADESVCLGPAPALQSYLNMDAVIAAAKATGAQAVHPGYGFLSENSQFVERLDAAGIAFVGPSAAAIRSLGDKVESKRIARDAKLNIIPGWVGAISDEAHAVKVADEMGYPVMVKASMGGGGKGLRIAWNEAQLRDELMLARAEAYSAFGTDTILIEKYVEQARHIEFQIIGDKHGHLVYLPERDCSIQRRHQKVLEESPSPFITPEVRKAMGEQALQLARAVGYSSTGTVEFVVDQKSDFFFLEMNTRLQVEHPVTEAITGIDLVELMLRVAAGQSLDLTQERASTFCGWALEGRVYAEDPSRQFLPSPGMLLQYHQPSGPNVRVDTGVSQGSEISTHYDSMLCKVVTNGETRAEAIANMGSALDQFVIRGVTTNLPHLRAVLSTPAFLSGDYDTTFIATYYSGPNALDPRAFPLTPSQTQQLLAVAAFLQARRQLQLDPSFLPASSGVAGVPLVVSMSDVHNAHRVPTHVTVRRAPRGMVGAEAAEGGALEVQLPDRVLIVELATEPPSGSSYVPGLHFLQVDGAPVCVQVVSQQPRSSMLQFCGTHRQVFVESPKAAALQRHMPQAAPSHHHRQVCSPMTGTLVKLSVTHGSQVRVGDELCVIEAMKMRNAIKASEDGIVETVHVREGQMVTADAKLVTFW